jgi:hypothetical protein
VEHRHTGEYEVKEKDAIETAAFNETLYEDTRHKVIEIPGAEVGSIVGFEYEQKRRPYVLQDRWFFQDWVPVRRAHFVLELPKSWEFDAVWMNQTEQEPRAAGRPLGMVAGEHPAMEKSRRCRTGERVAGWLAVTYYPSREALRPRATRGGRMWEVVHATGCRPPPALLKSSGRSAN